MRSATVEVWITEGGRWGASVTVRVEGQSDWHEKASGLHSWEDAMAWAQARVGLAVRA